MLFLPHLFDSEDYKVPVVSDEIDEFSNESTMCAKDFSKEFEECALTVMNSLGLLPRHDVKERLELYNYDIDQRSRKIGLVFFWISSYCKEKVAKFQSIYYF